MSAKIHRFIGAPNARRLTAARSDSMPTLELDFYTCFSLGMSKQRLERRWTSPGVSGHSPTAYLESHRLGLNLEVTPLVRTASERLDAAFEAA